MRDSNHGSITDWGNTRFLVSTVMNIQHDRLKEQVRTGMYV